MTTTERDPGLPARLLLTERDALLAILDRTPAEAFDRPTLLPGWTVRDVIAHCAGALSMTARGTTPAFTDELNEKDVAERRTWPLTAVLDELRHAYEPAATAITDAGGSLDGLALGEWVHGGDIRDALDEPRAFESEGVDDALVLLVERSRQPDRQVPLTRVQCGDRELVLGVAAGPDAAAELSADVATLIRLCSGRRPDPRRFTLTGAPPEAYVLFG